MNEIKKCPFCGGNAQIQIDVRDFYVDVKLLCDGCDAFFKCSMHLNGSESIPDAVNECFTDVLERWNTRAEEPQEHKESNVEWALNEIKKGTFFYNVCNLAHITKWYVPCVEEDCGECEFRNKTNAINYLLAPHED